MSRFEEQYPSRESYWRAIILFGHNVASYKFALGRALLSLASDEKTFVSLQELAAPFSDHIVQHIKTVDAQGQRPTGPFLDACRKAAEGNLSSEKLREITVRYGFQNVIDAFHTVNSAPIPMAFFEDSRKQRKGLIITDELLALRDTMQFDNLPIEIEARWSLVETAWSLGISRNLLQVNCDDELELFVTNATGRRRTITSCRDALNGYQKGKCFYCFRDITILHKSVLLADVDHFFPWSLGRDRSLQINLNGVWNLVLACTLCNRGPKGKSSLVPELRFLDRLERRNDDLIRSHHPLRDTLLAQTGNTKSARIDFLQRQYNEATSRLIHRWKPVDELEEAF